MGSDTVLYCYQLEVQMCYNNKEGEHAVSLYQHSTTLPGIAAPA